MWPIYLDPRLSKTWLLVTAVDSHLHKWATSDSAPRSEAEGLCEAAGVM